MSRALRRMSRDELLVEAHALRLLTYAQKDRLRKVEASRDRWRREARSWKWGALAR